jgi:hypothetical protein
MVFPPNVDETGGSSRSAAPIHRIVRRFDPPAEDRTTLLKPIGREGHGQKRIRRRLGNIGNFGFFCENKEKVGFTPDSLRFYEGTAMEKVDIPGPEQVTIMDCVTTTDHSTLDATVNSIGQDCSKEPDKYLQACESRFSGE